MSSRSRLELLLMLLFSFSLISLGFECIERERDALLNIKNNLVDNSGLLSSWGSEVGTTDCCQWRGVVCSNRTGHVIRLHLNGNYLEGNLSSSIIELQHLHYLDLSGNRFGGQSIPEFIGSLKSLRYLDVSYSDFGGRAPHQLRNLSRLQFLDVSYNHQMHGGNLEWLSHLSFLKHLRLSRVNLTQAVDWLHFITGLPSLTELDLSYCNLPSPPFFTCLINSSKSLSLIDLSSNDLSHSEPFIYNFLSNSSDSLFHIDLSGTNFSGSVSFLCSMGTALEYLDLSYNTFFGELPNCSWPLENLSVLNLANNNFSGRFTSIRNSNCSLKVLNLSSNNFTGALPDSLNMCKDLLLFDVSWNQFSGTIPNWIGDGIKHLSFLSLRSNHFKGHIPVELCTFSKLKIMDLSGNNLSGKIPYCLYNLASMEKHDRDEYYVYNSIDSVAASKYPEYKAIFRLLTVMDLSSNKLVGEIPVEITYLDGFAALNLSHNYLTGPIPREIVNIKWLEALDLSNNKLTGEIPPDLCSLSYLAILNLSYNNLHGKIPFGNQLATFYDSSYLGNQNLCGVPLENECPHVQASERIPHDENIEDVMLTLEFFACTTIGFIIGFWGVVGSLILKRSWRHAYFQFLSDAKDRFCVAIILSVRNLKTWFTAGRS